jgi:Skp family chaperone for outer membrane proteins
MIMTKKLALVAALSLASVSVPALAQSAAVIITVDMEQVINTSTAGKSAQTQLQAQANALQAKAQSLDAGFRSENDALNKAAQSKTMTQQALEQKAADLQKRVNAAQVDMTNRQRQFVANQQYVGKQISDAVQPIISQVQAEKNATLVLDEGSVIKTSPSIDVTALVLQRLNAKLPSVNVNAPASAATAGGR